MTVTFGANAWPLGPISLLYGLGTMAVFRYMSDRPAISAVKAKIMAHFLELRLFVDEPAVIWRAQIDLIKTHARLIAFLTPPALALSIPTILLMTQLDAVYGRAPLPIGQASVVTARLARPLEARSTAALGAPSAFAGDRPAVRIDFDNQISWRIRPMRAVSGVLSFRVADTLVEKSVVAGDGPRYKSERRIRNLASFLLQPTEPRLPEGQVRWMEIQYPPAQIQWWGVTFHWIVWFFLISMIGAFGFGRALTSSYFLDCSRRSSAARASAKVESASRA